MKICPCLLLSISESYQKHLVSKIYTRHFVWMHTHMCMYIFSLVLALEVFFCFFFFWQNVESWNTTWKSQCNFFLSHRGSRNWRRRGYDYLQCFISIALFRDTFFSNLYCPTWQPPGIVGYWVLAMWLNWTEIDSKIHIGFWRLSIKQRI